MTGQQEAITIRTSVLAPDGDDTVHWQDYPTLREALDTLSDLALVAMRQYGLANVEATNPEQVRYVKPNGYVVTSAIMHDLTEYTAP